MAYMPILKRGSRFSSDTGLNFVLIQNVNFADPANPMVVGRVDSVTGAPTHYAIKAYGNVVSGYFSQEEVDVGPFQRFKRIELSSPNVSEIISVVDAEGNEYFEVDYLSQDMVFKEITNPNFRADNVSSVLKPYLVSRKFVVERDSVGTYMQFGSGKPGDSNVIASPQKVALDIYGKSYVTDTTFDPTRLSQNENFGIGPENTTLNVFYRVTNPTNSNLAAGQLINVSNGALEFDNRASLVDSTVNAIIQSLEVNNELPIVGDVSNPSAAEIKRRIYDTFPTQNRAVTQADYENIVYRMPAKFGSIKRCSVQKDPDSQKRNLNMYVVSDNSFGKLIKTNGTIKNNLKTWIDQYRMVNDTVDILDPYILNIGIEFVIRSTSGIDKYDLLDSAMSAIQKRYQDAFFIGEPIFISDIYSVLSEVKGVLDVLKVKLSNKLGAEYSTARIDINKNLSPDGDYLVVPKNAILEIKFPQTDIIGRIR